MLIIVYMLLQYFAFLLIVGFIHLVLTPKHEDATTVFIWFIIGIIQPIARALQLQFEAAKVWAPLFVMVSIVFFVFLLYFDPTWKKITAIILGLAGTFFADDIARYLILVFDLNDEIELNSINFYSTVMQIVPMCMVCIIFVLFLFLWHLLDIHILMLDFFPMLILPIGQMLFAFGLAMEGQGRYNTYFFIAETLSFILEMYWIYDLTMRGRRTALEEELKAAKLAMELEKKHIIELEHKRQVMTKIRHDINNQIQSVRNLILLKDTGPDYLAAASTMLDELEELVNTTKEHAYCSVPIINAVLSGKKLECNNKEIAFEVNIELDKAIDMDNVLLCSLFCNLIDNAIHGVEEYARHKDHTEERKWIHLSVLTKGGMLLIELSNPALPLKKIRAGHGHGIPIIQEITETYQGNYNAEFKDGIYHSSVYMEVDGL